MTKEEQLLALLSSHGIEEGCRRFRRQLSPSSLQPGLSIGEGTFPLQLLPEESRDDLFRGELQVWSLLWDALLTIRERAYEKSLATLEKAREKAQEISTDPSHSLSANIFHLQGTAWHHRGDVQKAITSLQQSLELFGKNHFCTPRVLDTLGMAYSSKHNFLAARDFYDQALEYKAAQDPPDIPGLALTHGQLGRLSLEWGALEKAEFHFKEDLALSEELEDMRSIAIISNQLARVELAKGCPGAALEWNEKSYHLARERGWAILTFFACKEFILIKVAATKPGEALPYLEEAERIINSADFTEGKAFLLYAMGILERESGFPDRAALSLREARDLFDGCSNWLDAAKAQLEIARTSEKKGDPPLMVMEELTLALDRAEKTRRHHLVREVEEEIKRIDLSQYCLRAYRRARGRRINEDTVSLITGQGEEVSIIFLDIQRFTDFSRSEEPETVFMTLNQIFYDLSEIFEHYEITVNQYLGDGFMAIVRGADHPDRAVRASLAIMEAIREFNSPRKVLELPLLLTRIGINTGPVYLGNVGTYTKIDFTGIGTTTNQAARFQSEAEAGTPCISRNTYIHIKDHFIFKEGNPRVVNLKGLGEREAWDVVGTR